MIERFEFRGQLVSECSIPGERRADNVAPAHPNGIQLSRDRFLLLISTLGFRGVDDALSVLYQVREGDYDGPVINEGLLSGTTNDWDPLGDGSRYVRQLGHPVAFGVPKSALIDGKPAPHANLFVAKWRVTARVLHPDGYLLWNSHPGELTRRTSTVNWVQFRLNETEDDIEIVQPEQQLRQSGFESGERFCAADDCAYMNQSYVQAVPFNSEATEWVDVCHFNWGDGKDKHASKLAALKYRFNPTSSRYEWTEIGPRIEADLFEGNISRWLDDWIICGRPIQGGPIGWAREHDPLSEKARIVFPSDPQTKAPLTAYRCADGVLRLFTGDARISPHKKNRNPLYCWEIDPEHDFAASNCRVVLDTVAAGLDIPADLDTGPHVDMPKLLPHAGGGSQLLVYRIRTNGLFHNDPAYGLRRITPGEFHATGIYASRVTYAQDIPARWAFASGERDRSRQTFPSKSSLARGL